MAVDQRLTNSEGASVGNQRGVRVYGNSHGFLAGFASSSHSISCVLLASEAEDMQRDFWYSTARDPKDLEDAAAIGRRAGENAVARLGAHRLSTRRAPVMFIPEMARGLFRSFIGAIRGGSQYRKTTFLLDAAGQSVFPDFVQIEERPHIVKGLASSPFDGEGVATRDRQLVIDGVAQGYVLDSYSARKLGLRTTGNADGVHNLFIRSSQAPLTREALLRTMGTGLLVTELMGQGVNAVTGDYSRGASGFWVENGVPAYPVHEITIAGNLREMFKGIAALGADVDDRGALHTGSVLIGDLTIAGE
jgi:PmbA protein